MNTLRTLLVTLYMLPLYTITCEPPTSSWPNHTQWNIPHDLCTTTLSQRHIDTIIGLIQTDEKGNTIFITIEFIKKILKTEQEECDNSNLFPLTYGLIELMILQTIYQAQIYGYAGNNPIKKMTEILCQSSFFNIIPTDHKRDLKEKIMWGIQRAHPPLSKDKHAELIQCLFYNDNTNE